MSTKPSLARRARVENADQYFRRVLRELFNPVWLSIDATVLSLMTSELPPTSSLQLSRPMASKLTWKRLGVGVGLSSLLLFLAWLARSSDDNTREVASIKQCLSQRRFNDAERSARSWLKNHRADIEVTLLHGEALQRLGRLADATQVYATIPNDSGKNSLAARLATASIHLVRGRLADAEQALNVIGVPYSTDPNVDGLWVSLYSLSGRRWESMPALRRTLPTVGDRLMKLIYLANPDDMPAPPEDVFAKMFAVRDHLGLLGCARVAASLGRGDQALKLIDECLSQRPDLIEAHVVRGGLLLDHGESRAVDTLLNQLPANIDQHPGIWFVRGRRTQENGDIPAAIRCYWEVLKRHPNHDRSTYQLSQLLASEGRTAEARVFLERAGRLTRLLETSIRLFENRRDEADLETCAKLTWELGRRRECRVWCEYLLEINPNHEWAARRLNEVISSWRDDMPWTLLDNDLARVFDLSTYPLPKPFSIAPPTTKQLAPDSAAQISFVDDSARLGLEFEYFNGDDPSSEGKRMFEYTGGGVAALDYDHDGWCDLYFTQGCAWPPNPTRQKYLDAIYRNVGGNQMMDVTEHTGIRDASFGQGVAAGDYNNDGFIDLYVANVDGNRLQRNNGDGTFTDVTDAVGYQRHGYWTTSCLLADIDGDALPDIFDVTFLQGDDIFNKICRDSDGVARSCAPAGFPAAPDRVHINAGDGGFLDVSEGRGFEAAEGDGLGIVAADFDNSGDISLFVGNDGRANFYFVPLLKADDKITKWEEIGVLSGLAYDDVGAAQACMGIAAGDANGDGRLDLFVSNFYHESNTLYLNIGTRTFSDRARSTGLRDPSWEQLGFGTQFLDADLDGWEDLIVTNGHVDDFTHKQIPYKMRPQFFTNRNGRFYEKSAAEIGPSFGVPRLGRGLAKVDWNRDGLTDVVISHIADSAVILTNQTRSAGGGLGLRLVGTTRSRDAIGTRVIARTKHRTLERQLTAGDGYQASNERRLEFGFDEENLEAVDIEIRWPGGRVELYAGVSIRRDYLAVEGKGRLIETNVD